MTGLVEDSRSLGRIFVIHYTEAFCNKCRLRKKIILLMTLALRLKKSDIQLVVDLFDHKTMFKCGLLPQILDMIAHLDCIFIHIQSSFQV